jgi:hypothetical protein
MQLKNKLIFISLFFAFNAFSQVVLSPITEEKREDINRYYSNFYKTSATLNDTLSLPFFDDFFSSTGNPDSNKWENSGGVFVNNRFCTPNPPTYNVATFDGLNRFGSPYAPGASFADGYTDTLTSRFINLEGYTAADSIYLSFFYQAGGVGELPDSLTDSLWVEYRNLANEWEFIWSAKANTNRDFQAISLPISATEYLHSAFQFRIRANGNQSGAFDIWNVDYVYLNANRKPDDYYLVDVAFSQTPKKFLKRFSSMPYWQFFANAANEVNDSSYTTINNMDVNAAIVTSRVSLFDYETNTTLQQLSVNNGFFMQGSQQQRKIDTFLSASSIINNDTISKFGVKYFLTTQDQNTFNLPLKNNDTLVAVTELADYVSYDDGTAEYGFGINQRFAKVAQKFTLNTPDTLKSLLIHFAKAGYDRSNETVTLRVWESISDSFDSIVWNMSVKINYSDKMNGFYRYDINPPIIVNNTFYVGWRQLTNNLINVGFDIHNDAKSEIFYTVNNKWTPLDDFSGSLLIRPEMYRTKLLNVKNTELKEFSAKPIMYPNPTTDATTIELEADNVIEIYDLTGKKQIQVNGKKGLNTIDVSSLSEGMYMVKVGQYALKLIRN